MADEREDITNYPKLGQWLHKLAVPNGTTWLIRLLIVGCVVFVGLDLTYEKHGYMEMERYLGFYAAYGFVMFTCLILVAKALRWFIKRPEDYYSPHSIDTEDYPEDGLGRADHDG